MRSFVFSSLVLLACVGDSTITPMGDGGVDASMDVVQQNDSPSDVVTMDVSIKCDGGSTVIACGGTCVDISSSGSSCGACNHDCGGGTCTGGACQPVVVVDTLTYPVFDVDGTNVYYNKGDSNTGELDSCALATGCKLAPTTIGAPGLVYPSNNGGKVLLLGKNLAFFGELASNPGRARLFACDGATGCGTAPPTILNAGLQSFDSDLATYGSDVYFTYYHYLVHATCTAPNTCSANENLAAVTGVWPRIGLSADATAVYYVDPTSHALVSCPKSGPCTPATLLASLSSTALNTAAYGGNVYVLDSNMSGYSKGTIVVCPNTGTCTPSTFVNTQPYPTLITADAQGVYWFDSDAQDIKMCPLTGCKPSTRTLATKQAATVLHTDASFVYWATATQILRVAK
jgi:hypothetical protein